MAEGPGSNRMVLEEGPPHLQDRLQGASSSWQAPSLRSVGRVKDRAGTGRFGCAQLRLVGTGHNVARGSRKEET